MVVKKNSTKTKVSATKKGAAGKDGSYKAKAELEQKVSASVDKDNASAAYSQKAEAAIGIEGFTGNENIGASGSTTATVSIEQSINISAGLDKNNVYAEVGAKDIAQAKVEITAETHIGPVNAGVEGTAYVKTGASAEASARVGDEGVKAEGELFAGTAAGVDGSATVAVSGVSTTTGAGVSAGEQVGIGGGGEATFKDGVATVGVSGEVAVLVGAEVDLSVSVDTKKIEEDAKAAAEASRRATEEADRVAREQIEAAQREADRASQFAKEQAAATQRAADEAARQAAEAGNIVTRTIKRFKFW